MPDLPSRMIGGGHGANQHVGLGKIGQVRLEHFKTARKTVGHEIELSHENSPWEKERIMTLNPWESRG